MNVHHQSAKPNGAPPPRSVHPGSGRRKTRDTPKGRQVDPQALDEVRALLGDRPRRRDLLIEHLHLLQDQYGCLHARHLVALADEMRLALAEVYEVASFYAHFDIVMDGEPAPPPVTVRVCDSLTCALMGAERLLGELPSGSARPSVRVVRAPCMGGCDNAPVAAIGHALHEHATRRERHQGGRRPARPHPHVPGYHRLRRLSRRRRLRAARAIASPAGARSRTSSRRSRIRTCAGSAAPGFPTGRKWRFVRAEPAPRLMAVNADEGEPGTFKDRLLSRDRPAPLPRRHADRAPGRSRPTEVYIYLRDEYPQCREILQREIAQLEAAGLSRAHDASTCAAAPAPTSAARNRRCSRASRASAGCRATSRPSRARSACSAGRR